ncbi:MAG: FkbM family methyltransferase [Patescibacteria group bacterium]
MKKYIRKLLSFIILLFNKTHWIVSLILWPLAKRGLGQNYLEVVQIGDGIKLKVYSDMYDMVNKVLMFYSDFVTYAWEPVTTRLFQKLIKGKKCIVIAGAHLGYYPLIAARFNINAIIYAFEPVTYIYDRFIQNIELNHFLNIRAEPQALSNQNSETDIIKADGGSTIILSQYPSLNKGKEKCHCVTIDDYFNDKDEKPDFMLLDVEGSEYRALAGAEQVLKVFHPDIIFEIYLKDTAQADTIVLPAQLLDRHGYELYVIHEQNEPMLIGENFPIVLSRLRVDDVRHLKGAYVNILATRDRKKIKLMFPSISGI